MILTFSIGLGKIIYNQSLCFRTRDYLFPVDSMYIAKVNIVEETNIPGQDICYSSQESKREFSQTIF